MLEQNNNRSSSRFVTIDGVTRTAAERARVGGIPRQTVVSRLDSGWDPRVAVTTPQYVNKEAAHYERALGNSVVPQCAEV